MSGMLHMLGSPFLRVGGFSLRTLDVIDRPSTTCSWMSHEEAAHVRTNKRLKESRFTLPGQIDDGVLS